MIFINNSRRKEIKDIVSRLEDCQNDLESVISDEEDVMYNLEEKFSETERYQNICDIVDNLNSSNDILSDAIRSLNSYE